MRCKHPKNKDRLLPKSCDKSNCPRKYPIPVQGCWYQKSEETIALVGVNENALRVCLTCGLEAHTKEDLKLFKTHSRTDPRLKYYPYGKDPVCLNCYRKYDRQFHKKDNLQHPRKYRERTTVFNKRNPEKILAGLIARKYLKPKNACEVCGSEEYLSMHHPNYSNPLETTTLCSSCHHKANRNKQS